MSLLGRASTLVPSLRHFLSNTQRGKNAIARLGAFLVYMGRLSLYTWKQLVKDKCLTSASALAFATLGAIIPVATVAFTVYRASTGLGGFEDYVKKRVFEWMLAVPTMTQQETVPPAPAPQPTGHRESPPTQPDQQDEEGKPVSLEVAAQKYSESVAKWVTLLSDQLRGYTANIISVTALIVMSVFLLNTVEGAFNDVWHTSLKRSFLYKFVVFWAVFTLGPVFIGASFFI